MPRNPQLNDLPLPEWVELKLNEGTSKDGKKWRRYRYIDHRYTVQNRYGLCTDTVETPLPCPALPRVPKGTQGAGGGETGEPLARSRLERARQRQGRVENKAISCEHCLTCGGRSSALTTERLWASTLQQAVEQDLLPADAIAHIQI